MTHVIYEGTTEPQDFQIKADGANLVGTDLTLGIVIKDKTKTAVTLTGTVAWLDQAGGTVRYTPPTGGELTKASGPYSVRWSLTAGSSIGYAPNGITPDQWVIVTP